MFNEKTPATKPSIKRRYGMKLREKGGAENTQPGGGGGGGGG
ncbi:hypothetical protein HMPREF9553_02217, partial [Escherichia coli MS 200-1]